MIFMREVFFFFLTSVHAEIDKSPWYLTLDKAVVPQGPGLMKGSHLQHHASQRAQTLPCGSQILGVVHMISVLWYSCPWVISSLV